ncbi:hypothetical protein BHM03_00044919 [Ensete ventricosum]|uniref:Uncharacterized protein n=1 Tax=Ensete ventricosum TaxID=4639 RepID=A0A445MKP9_ENSVE|nr:hypothetical protein BHM03_00044919 [Ensete ventricosum]
MIPSLEKRVHLPFVSPRSGRWTVDPLPVQGNALCNCSQSALPTPRIRSAREWPDLCGRQRRISTSRTHGDADVTQVGPSAPGLRTRVRLWVRGCSLVVPGIGTPLPRGGCTSSRCV